MLDECCNEDRVCLTAQEFVEKAKDDLSVYFDPKTLLIALYFLSSSKASVKAQHIAQLFFDFP